MSHTDDEDLAYVEFVFRVHTDGKRERRATVYVHEGDAVRPARTPLSGAAAHGAMSAIEEAILAPQRARRVAIDPRPNRRAERRWR